MSSAPLSRQNRNWLPLAALVGGNCALALGPWAVRLADTGPVSAGFWRLALALPFLFLFAWKAGERPFSMPRGTLLAVVAAGVFFAFDLASWHIGIGLTKLGNATLLGNAGSLILMVWGFMILRRMPRVPEWAALAAAVTGWASCLDKALKSRPRHWWGICSASWLGCSTPFI